MRRDKIAALSKVLSLDPRVIMGWDAVEEIQQQEYYTDPETARRAQEVFDDPNLRVLFDAASGAKPEDIQMAADLLKRLKGTNLDG